MARTFPTYGLSPIDSYVTQKNLPAGYFEHYASVTEGVAYAVQAKVTQGATKYITGLMAAGSFELNLGACPDALASFGVVELRFDNSGTGAMGNVENGAFILLREKSTGGYTCQHLFASPDIVVGVTGGWQMFCATGSARTHSHSLRIKIKGVPYWIMCTTTAP